MTLSLDCVFSRAFDSSCISSLDQVDIGTRQVGGVNPAPVDLGSNLVVMDEHFAHVVPLFGVRVGVFRFVPTDEEVERGSLKRDRFQGFKFFKDIFLYFMCSLAALSKQFGLGLFRR